MIMIYLAYYREDTPPVVDDSCHAHGESEKRRDSWGDVDIVKLQVLGLRLAVDFTFTLDNNDNNDDNDNDNNNPHLNFFKGTVLGVKEQG